MKKSSKTGGGMDPAGVALLFGLSVGLGIVVHESLYLVAGAVAAGVAAAAIANIIYDHAEHSGLTHQHH